MNKLIAVSFHEEQYLPYLKPMFSGQTTYHVTQEFQTLTALELYCRKRDVDGVVCTQKSILIKLLALRGNNKTTVSLENYAGSLFEYKGIAITFLNDLSQIFTVKYGKFMAARQVSKITTPGNWRRATKFIWEIGTPSNLGGYHELFATAFAIAVDIETFKERLAIRCVGFTGIFIAPDRTISTRSICIPLTDSVLLVWARKFAELAPPKVTQNGKYDNSYLLRYNIILRNWFWDTANIFHCMYSELPKDLAFLGAYAIWDAIYWKDLAESGDLHQYYEYNCRDHWITANAFIALIELAPTYAERNYILEFPLNYPCLYSEMQGLKRNEKRLLEENARVEKDIETEQTSLTRMLGVPINPNSPKQVAHLLTTLGCKDIATTWGTGEAYISKASFRHPLLKRILDKILSIRGYRKLL